MNKEVVFPPEQVNTVSLSKGRNFSTIVTDLKSLFKALVLVSNVLPVFTGVWLALHFSNRAFADVWEVILLTVIGSILVMAGALLINNWYDVDIDSVMERTKQRPTVTGNIPLNVVLTLGIALTVLGFIFLLFTTVEAMLYAFIGWFTYVFLYTMISKRKYTLGTIVGSVSGAVTPLIGWGAIDSTLHVFPIALFLILFIWQVPHTFAIAIKRCDEYKAAGVALLPVVHGFDITKRQMLVYIICLLPLPFYLASLGTTFLIIATLLNVGWLVLGITGFFTKDTIKWARVNFIYSVNYITFLFFLMVIVTL